MLFTLNTKVAEQIKMLAEVLDWRTIFARAWADNRDTHGPTGRQAGMQSARGGQ